MVELKFLIRSNSTEMSELLVRYWKQHLYDLSVFGDIEDVLERGGELLIRKSDKPPFGNDHLAFYNSACFHYVLKFPNVSEEVKWKLTHG